MIRNKKLKKGEHVGILDICSDNGGGEMGEYKKKFDDDDLQ